MPKTYVGVLFLWLTAMANPFQLRAELREAVYPSEGQILKVSVEMIDTLIKSESEVLNFPGMIEFTGKLILPYGRGRHGGKEGRPAAISIDGGKSWNDLRPDSPFSDNIQ